jgi:hypothetical protein
MLEAKAYWLSYWQEKFNVQEEYDNLQGYKSFSLEDVQNQFLLSIFYVNMITSTVVDMSDPEWEKNLKEKRR